MPTKRPRHTITETDAIAQALVLAQQRWPHERNRRKLLLRLIAEGEKAVRADEGERVRVRREAILRHSGAATGMYPPGYLNELRADWPE
jgi:hypothetical protein